MESADSRTILIAGAGIAGLTAGLAFARHGFDVRIFERAERLEEVGAGLQLSPNATRILDRLGALDRLRPMAVAPEAVVLADAATLRERARIPLGKAAEERWGAPYLVAHRADLQQALLAAVSAQPGIECFTSAEVSDVVFAGGLAEAHLAGAVAAPTRHGVERGALLVGADGVWSKVRRAAGLGASRFTGHVAWRVTVSANMPEARRAVRRDVVSAFLHPGVHLVAYPVRAGAEINLVAIHKGGGLAESWQNAADPGALFDALQGAHPDLVALVTAAGRWLAWPLHAAKLPHWTRHGRLALIGDAAHAMTPFAAQGAAMAIEDATVLAELVGAALGNVAGALARYEVERRPRVARAARRGALNHLAWQAAGPVALARNLVLRLRPAQSLMADLDWLYGWDGVGSRP